MYWGDYVWTTCQHNASKIRKAKKDALNMDRLLDNFSTRKEERLKKDEERTGRK